MPANSLSSGKDRCFPNSLRIKKRSEFTELYNQGQKINGFYYAVYFFYGGKLQIGIAVPKRLGNAVFRNRQKRLVRETFRKIKSDFLSSLKIAVVLIRKPNQPEDQKKELDRILLWLCHFKYLSEN